MTTLQLINKIAESTEIENVVIKDQDDKPPMDAIAYLCYEHPQKSDWRINSTLEKGTLLVYDNQNI